MEHSDRVKRRVLRQVVRENLEVVQGLPPRVLRRSRQLRQALTRALLFTVVPTVGFLGLSALATGRGDVPDAARETPAPLATFPAPQPIDFLLGVRKVVLDPGHGGADSGARAAAGVWEKEVTLDVARRLGVLLRESSFEVALTREGDQTVSLRERAELANAWAADLFISIHVNSVPNPGCHAVETYHVGRAGDPLAERLAGAENRQSGYSMADFRRLLEGVYAHVRQDESRKLARLVQGGLVAQLGRVNPDLRDAGVKSAPFLVLVATESPGILAEVSCLSNDEEAERLADPGYREKIARGLWQGIRAYADVRNRLTRASSLQENP